MKKLFSIGYEGADLDRFVATLKQANVDVLLDVREIPISRRKGFSKSALREALETAGIAYRHEKQLGSPKTIRHRLREDKNYSRFFRDFDKHLDKQIDLLETLARELKGNVALMCYEKDHSVCHRTPVIEALADMLNKKPNHLGVDDHGTRKTSNAAYPHFSKSFSTA